MPYRDPEVAARFAQISTPKPILGAFLFGVEGFDLPTYAGVAILFLALSTLASDLPARRLLRVDPVMVLKEE